VRLRRCRWRPHLFARQGGNIVDTIVIVVSLLPVAGAGVSLLRVARLARMLHVARHVTHMRVERQPC